MRLVDSPGTAVMISHNAPRYTHACQCFEALTLPAGSRKEHFAAGMDLAKAREAIAEDFTGAWLYFVDDDHLFPPDTLLRLLERLDEAPDVDVVSAFVLRRWTPHPTVIGRLNANGTASMVEIQQGRGLHRDDLTGLGGGAVIRASAFNKVPQPWFTGGRFTEDWTFCERLKHAGGQCAVDLDTVVGHITPMAVWPTKNDAGEWGVSYTLVRDGKQRFSRAHADNIVGNVPVAV